MKKILPILVGVMIIAVGVIGYLVYGAYQEYVGEDELTETQAKMIDSLRDMNYPMAVRDGHVSAEYYDGMMSVLSSYVDLLEIVANDVKDYESIEEASHNFLAELSTYKVYPSTSVDYDLDEYLTKYIIQTKMSAEYYIDYATKKDKLYFEMANDYRDDASNSLNTIDAIGKKYGINEF